MGSTRELSLVYLTVDVQHSQLRWHRYDRTTGESLELIRFLPSREQTLQFSFFDQYAGFSPFTRSRRGTADIHRSSSRCGYATCHNRTHGLHSAPHTSLYTAGRIASGSFACWNMRAG